MLTDISIRGASSKNVVNRSGSVESLVNIL